MGDTVLMIFNCNRSGVTSLLYHSQLANRFLSRQRLSFEEHAHGCCQQGALLAIGLREEVDRRLLPQHHVMHRGVGAGVAVALKTLTTSFCR